MVCTRCDGWGFTNMEQLPDDAPQDPYRLREWLKTWAEPNDVAVCDCCGDGEEWYGEPGQHYGSQDPPGKNGPYAYNGGLCECH